MLICQKRRIQRLFQVQFGYDTLEPHFHNELRAFYDRRRHWTTHARNGNMQPNQHRQTHFSHDNPTDGHHATHPTPFPHNEQNTESSDPTTPSVPLRNTQPPISPPDSAL
nr:hypothetical protein CFP56_58006 [Quercus suber]